MFKCAVLQLLQVIRWFSAPCLWKKKKQKTQKTWIFVSSVYFFLWQIISLQTVLSIYLGCSKLIIFHSICAKISINISYFLLILYFFELIFRYLPMCLIKKLHSAIIRCELGRKTMLNLIIFPIKTLFYELFLQVVLPQNTSNDCNLLLPTTITWKIFKDSQY